VNEFLMLRTTRASLLQPGDANGYNVIDIYFQHVQQTLPTTTARTGIFEAIPTFALCGYTQRPGTVMCYL